MNLQTKEKVSRKLLQQIKKACAPHGKKQLLADLSGIRNNTLHLIIKEGMSTPETIQKVESGLKLMKSLKTKTK